MGTAKDRPLTASQERFAQLLFQGKEQTEAKLEAYPNSHLTGLSLRVDASKLAANPKIQARLAELRAPTIKRLQLDDLRVMAEYKAIMESDARDYLEWDENGVHVKPSSELTDAQAKAVAGVTERVNAQGVRTIEVKLYPRTAAIDAIAERVWPVPKVDPIVAPGNTLNVTINAMPTELLTLIHQMYVSGALQAFLETRPEYKALVEGKVHESGSV